MHREDPIGRIGDDLEQIQRYLDQDADPAVQLKDQLTDLILSVDEQSFDSDQALGFDLFGLLARWSSEIFHFAETPVAYAEITKNPLAENEERMYSSPQAMLEDFGITAPCRPPILRPPAKSRAVGRTKANKKPRLPRGRNHARVTSDAHTVSAPSVGSVRRV